MSTRVKRVSPPVSSPPSSGPGRLPLPLLLPDVTPDVIPAAHLRHAAVLHVARGVAVPQLLEPVRDPHGGDFRVRVHDVSHRPHHPGLIRLVEEGGELVQQQHARVLHQRPGDGHPLLLPPRQRRDLPSHELVRIEVHRGERGSDARVHLLPAHVRVPAIQRERDVVAHGGHDDLVVGVLKHERARRLDSQPTAPRRDEPGEGSQQRGLAAAVGAEEHEHRSARHAQAHALERILGPRVVGIPVPHVQVLAFHAVGRRLHGLAAVHPRHDPIRSRPRRTRGVPRGRSRGAIATPGR
mmetsp:Transcript_40/g.147  ORF Transcript_40/g.147 Transcript_40/m.147 type:complete len:296 (+) Transcript_40:17-904(+)